MTISQSLAQDLEFRRIDQLIQQNATAPVVTATGVFFFMTAGWTDIPHILLFSWAALWISAAIARMYMTKRWYKAKAAGHMFQTDELKLYNRLLIAGCFISSVCVGSIAAGSTIYLNADAQLYLGLVVLGMCSSSVAAYALSPTCGLGVLAPALTIWMASLIYMDGNKELFVLLGIFLVVNFKLSLNWNAFALNSLRTNAELKENQNRLRLALDSSGAACWAWEPATNAFDGDANMARVLGSTKQVFKTLDEYFECVHPQDLSAVRSAFANALEKGALDIEHRLVGGAERPRFVSMRGRVQGESGLRKIVAGITWDITDKRNEERIRFERDLLDRANRTKLMFLANVSHEMRTPLTAINGFTENVLSDSNLPSRLREKLNIVLRNGRYLTSVVHDLLDLSKAEADNIFIQNGKVNLPEEINDSIHVVRTGLERKHLKLEVVYDSPVPEMIVADATRLRQILINLLTNSIKYTDHGEIIVRVSFDSLDNSGQLRIVVADTGIGMTEQDIRNLFQPFTRGEATRVRQQHGSGLGLVLSRSLALRMGGDLRLLSTTPQAQDQAGGTAFELTLEVGPCEGVRRLQYHPVITSAARQPITSSETFQNHRVLLVEDDEDIRWLLQEYLEKRGANVVTCQNGAEGVKAAFEANFDAVLMDIKMPVLDGYQATYQLRSKGFRHPIIALTAHANSSDMTMCYEAGCDYYLSKPVDFNHLNDVLRRCIDRSRVHSHG